jgi:hypothetical protein
MVWTLRAPSESPVRRFRLLLAGSGLVGSVAISPDGRRIAYSRDGSLWVRDLDRLEPREIASGGDTGAVFWSPDSASVGHGSGGKLWKVPAGGDERMPLGALPEGGGETVTSGTWTPDGVIVFTTDGKGLLELSEENGEVAPFLELQDGEGSYRDVSALPYGRGHLYVIHSGPGGSGGTTPASYRLALVTGNTRKVLHDGGTQPLAGPVYSPTGHILFAGSIGEPGIWALPFNLTGLEATGEPFLVAPGGTLPTVSGDETLVYLVVPDTGPDGSSRDIVVVENWFAEGSGGG